jgi:hypothetical protein
VRPDGNVVPNASRATVFAEMIRSMTRDAPRTIAAAFARRRLKPKGARACRCDDGAQVLDVFDQRG